MNEKDNPSFIVIFNHGSLLDQQVQQAANLATCLSPFACAA